MRNRMVTITAFIALASSAMGVQATDSRTGMRPVAQPAMPIAVPAVANLVVDQIQVNPQPREGQPVLGVAVVVKNQGRAAGSAGAVRLSCRAAAGVACPASLTSVMLPLAPLAPSVAATLIVPPNGRDVWPAGKLTLAAEIVGTSTSKSVDLSVAKQLALERQSLNPQPEPPKPDPAAASPIMRPGTGAKPLTPSSPTPQGKVSPAPTQARATATPSPKSRQEILAALKAKHVAYDPQVRLREFKEAERSRKSAQIQSLKAAMLQKMPGMTAALSCLQPDPVIKSVGPQEVYPGFPIYIAGCHFGISQGMITIPQLNVQVEVTSWSDNWIEGKIPDSITGFSDPKTIGFKVVTFQASVLQAPATVVLKPSIDVVALSLAPQQAGALSGDSFCATDVESDKTGSWLFRVTQHTMLPPTAHCQGVDALFQGTQLKHSWTYFRLDLGDFVCIYDGKSTGGCQAAPAQNLNNWIGSSTVPSVQTNWSIDRPSALGPAYMLFEYTATIYIAGPAGTSYQ